MQPETISQRAKRIYEERLRASLEESHLHEFAAIEPVSGEHFLGKTLSEAIGAARIKFPHRLVHAVRVGHQSAIEFHLRIR